MELIWTCDFDDTRDMTDGFACPSVGGPQFQAPFDIRTITRAILPKFLAVKIVDGSSAWGLADQISE